MNKTVCIACDAGMGSSAMAASIIKKILPDMYSVINCAIDTVPQSVDILITHNSLADRITNEEKYEAIYRVDNFLDKETINKITKEIIKMNTQNILTKEGIILGCKAESNVEAIKAMGELLMKNGYIEEPYIEGMIKRDTNVSTYIGNEIAIPHGEYDVKPFVKQTGLGVMIFPEGIDWQGNMVRVVIGIAAQGDDHMTILSNIALKLSDMDVVNQLINSTDVDTVHEILTKAD